jgi:hypothetical protein
MARKTSRRAGRRRHLSPADGEFCPYSAHNDQGSTAGLAVRRPARQRLTGIEADSAPGSDPGNGGLPWNRPYAVPAPTVLSTWRAAIGPPARVGCRAQRKPGEHGPTPFSLPNTCRNRQPSEQIARSWPYGSPYTRRPLYSGELAASRTATIRAHSLSQSPRRGHGVVRIPTRAVVGAAPHLRLSTPALTQHRWPPLCGGLVGDAKSCLVAAFKTRNATRMTCADTLAGRNLGTYPLRTSGLSGPPARRGSCGIPSGISPGQPADQGPDAPTGRRAAGPAAHGPGGPAAAGDVAVPGAGSCPEWPPAAAARGGRCHAGRAGPGPPGSASARPAAAVAGRRADGQKIKISAAFHASSRRDSRSPAATRVISRKTNRRHMTGDHHGRTA